MSHQSTSNARKPMKAGDFLVFGVLDVMPGVYRATNAVVSRLSGSIHTSSDQRLTINDQRSINPINEGFRGGKDWLWATFGPLSSRVDTAHISLDGAYTPYADGLLQEKN